MTDERYFPGEDPVTTHARLSAAALAAHANACATADAFLRDGTTPAPENLPPDLVLAGAGPARAAVTGAETPDERRFTSREALQVYVRGLLVKSLSVRRDGWTLPGPTDGRIEPDTARLLLRRDAPAIDIVAEIGMNRSLRSPRLRYNDANDRMQPFDHGAHELDERGIRYIASLFAVPPKRPPEA